MEAPGELLLSAPSPQDGCGTNDSRPTFKILTENVVCGKSGVTCSRAIRISLGVSSCMGIPTWQPQAPGPGLSVPRGVESRGMRGGSSQKPDLALGTVHDVLGPLANGSARTGPGAVWASVTAFEDHTKSST